jgi:1-hydroxycarotenoid 3,4-desaturase
LDLQAADLRSSTEKCPQAMPQHTTHVVIVGAGIAGLAAAWDLAARGIRVSLFDRAESVGGKMHAVSVDGRMIDCGPTVITMRWIFDELFEANGRQLADHLVLERLEILARHIWPGSSQTLDLFADEDRTIAAISNFAGASEADGYRRFAARARETFAVLEDSFIHNPAPSVAGLTVAVARKSPRALWGIRPFAKLETELGAFFRDERLRQLFARYATYSGSSPYLCPATLMLIAHVELEGVWQIKGGIKRLAEVIGEQARAAGAEIHLKTGIERIEIGRAGAQGVIDDTGASHAADAVLFAGDVQALRDGLLGAEARGVTREKSQPRSLSALTTAMVAKTSGLALDHHNVFFCDDYAAEFDDIFKRGRLPRDPTVYVCAQDRGPGRQAGDDGERLFTIVNAPATGDQGPFPPEEIDRCLEAMSRVMTRSGLTLEVMPAARRITTPQDFATRFPGTGGSLYGMALHTPTAAFARPTARSRISGLYLAGGSAHPGPGLPMAATSGRLAARQILSDLVSTHASAPAATSGGMSTRSATTARTR